jgi:tetratricopeptide (TPR) repeat protein
VHRRIWLCHEHPADVFVSKAAFQKHLDVEHDNLTEIHAQQIASFAEVTVSDDRRNCPFCLNPGPFSNGLHNHMSFHQEQIAAFSLSWDTPDSNESDQNSFIAQGTRQGESLGSVILEYDNKSSTTVSSHGIEETEEAEGMGMQVLQGYEELFGSNHTSTLDAVSNLGNLYMDQGKLYIAEKMYSRALQGYEEALGLKHQSTLSIVNNLAGLYIKLGRLDEAEKMYSRALQGYEEALGLKHTSTLSIVNNLAGLYIKLGRLDEAEKMYSRALQGYEEALGPKHTSTLSIVNNLAGLYIKLGRLDEAEKMYSRALQGYEEALGPKHISTLDIVNNLAGLYIKLGRLDEAEKMYQRALHGYEKRLGYEHKRCCSVRRVLATMREIASTD